MASVCNFYGKNVNLYIVSIKQNKNKTQSKSSFSAL